MASMQHHLSPTNSSFNGRITKHHQLEWYMILQLALGLAKSGDLHMYNKIRCCMIGAVRWGQTHGYRVKRMGFRQWLKMKSANRSLDFINAESLENDQLRNTCKERCHSWWIRSSMTPEWPRTIPSADVQAPTIQINGRPKQFICTTRVNLSEGSMTGSSQPSQSPLDVLSPTYEP